MIKKTITYTDYNGEKQSEDFYFNLSKAELTELNFSIDGGLETRIRRIMNERDNKAIMAMFKDIILKSYGKKSDDGKRFIKSQELRDEFEQTEAYSELLMSFFDDAKKAADFINGILPKDMQDQIKAAQANGQIPK